MKRIAGPAVAALLGLAAHPAGAVNIGSAQNPWAWPWCNGCYEPQHLQLLVLHEEIGSSMTIGQVSWNRAPGGSGTAWFSGVEIYMGLCAADTLSESFESNYIPGSRTLVFQADTLQLTAGAGEWFAISLDPSYQFDGSANLLVEVLHYPGVGLGDILSWSWVAGPKRSLCASFLPSPEGGLGNNVCWMTLSGGAELRPATLASIKASFRP